MIKFHGVYIDPLAVIGIGEVKYYPTGLGFDVHLPGSVMPVTVVELTEPTLPPDLEYKRELARQEHGKLSAEINARKAKIYSTND